jgi:hypothetical protein
LQEPVFEVSKLKVYYSHPKWMYNTEEEEVAIKAIRKRLGEAVEILNPRDYDEDSVSICCSPETTLH